MPLEILRHDTIPHTHSIKEDLVRKTGITRGMSRKRLNSRNWRAYKIVGKAEEAKVRERCHLLPRSLEFQEFQKTITDNLSFLRHQKKQFAGRHSEVVVKPHICHLTKLMFACCHYRSRNGIIAQVPLLSRK